MAATTGWVVAAVAAAVAVGAVLWALRIRSRARAHEDQLVQALEQRGAHDDLLATCPTYAEIVASQLSAADAR